MTENWSVSSQTNTLMKKRTIMGSNIPITLEQFIEKANKKHDSAYDYSLVTKETYKDTRSIIEVVCPIHGSWYVQGHSHLNAKVGCRKCYFESNKTTREDFIKRSLKIFNGFYDYSEVEELKDGRNTVVTIICPVHGRIKQKANNHLYGKGCKECADEKRTSKGEKWLYALVDKAYPGLQVIPNDKSIVPPFEIDISIPDLNLYIEWNGGYWHSQKEVKRNDEKKKQILGENLIQVEEPAGFRVTKKFVVQQFKKVVRP